MTDDPRAHLCAALETAATELGNGSSPAVLADWLWSHYIFPMPMIRHDGTHEYTSTGCLHGDMVLPDGRTGHEYCQGETGAVGAKTPAVCKFCAAPCQCECHGEQPDPDEATAAREYGERVNAPLRPETVTALNQMIAAGDVPVRKVPRGAEATEAASWTVTTTVTGPTPEDAERWAAGIEQMVRAEFGDSMGLEVMVAPVVPRPATDPAAIVARVRQVWHGRREIPEIDIDAEDLARIRRVVDGKRRPSSLDLALVSILGNRSVDWLISGKQLPEEAAGGFRVRSGWEEPASAAGAAMGEEQP